MKDMCKHPRLQRRGGVYWFRCRIPADLIAHYGKREILKSLKTSDAQEALALVRQVSAAQDREFARVRRDGAVGAPPNADVAADSLTDDQIHALSREWVRDVLADDDSMRASGLSESMYAALDGGVEWVDQEVPERIAKGDADIMVEQAKATLAKHGIKLSPGSQAFKRVAYALLKSMLEVNDVIRRRQSGEVVETPRAPAGKTVTTARGTTLQQLMDYWAGQGDAKAPKTLIEARAAVRRLAEAAGSDHAGTVERKHVLAMRDAMAKEKSPATIQKQLGLLRAMYQAAIEDDKFGLRSNPVIDVRVRGDTGQLKRRAAFTQEELARIFASPVFSQGARPEGGAGEAAYWIPVIALYTGARLNEIGQLRVSDVQTADGVTFFRITDEGEGQRLKVGGSRRRVPVHPQLVALGFLGYVEQIGRGGEQRLFPRLRPNTEGHLTGLWSRWFNRYLDAVVGIPDPSRDFHSFRHTFKHQARECGMNEDVHDALTGHTNASVSRMYGGAEGYPLGPLKVAMEKLKYAPNVQVRCWAVGGK